MKKRLKITSPSRFVIIGNDGGVRILFAQLHCYYGSSVATLPCAATTLLSISQYSLKVSMSLIFNGLRKASFLGLMDFFQLPVHYF